MDGVRLLFDMLRIRLVEERIAEVYAEQEMRCPIHLCIGQEAVAVGVCAALQPTDYVMSGHRSHGHYLAKGGDLKAMIAEFSGKVTGCCGGKGGSMHLVDLLAGFLGATPIVGSTIPIAVGVAFGCVMKGDPRVVVSFFGEGATEEGVFHEAINFAVLQNLPVVFVCENNLYSVYSPLAVRQPAGRRPNALARAYGLESGAGDGNDVLEVAAMASAAVAKARNRGGPTFLEFSTYRWREHCGPNYDNDLGYRTVAEFEEWKARCPIRRFQARLTAAETLTPADVEEMTCRIEREIDEAFAFAKASTFPSADLLLEQVYAPLDPESQER